MFLRAVDSPGTGPRAIPALCSDLGMSASDPSPPPGISQTSPALPAGAGHVVAGLIHPPNSTTPLSSTTNGRTTKERRGDMNISRRLSTDRDEGTESVIGRPHRPLTGRFGTAGRLRGAVRANLTNMPVVSVARASLADCRASRLVPGQSLEGHSRPYIARRRLWHDVRFSKAPESPSPLSCHSQHASESKR